MVVLKLIRLPPPPKNRYLWPLIHYHKFLARCIKKLKRNGVDVKTSVSPVAVFLREEVCAVSDHLAAVSLFDSDEWMNCLDKFNGWTESDEKAETNLRELVSKQKLRPLTEPGDVDSPLLRSQIDEQFLRAMASARAQMVGVGVQQERRKPKEITKHKEALEDPKRTSQESLSSAAEVSYCASYASLEFAVSFNFVVNFYHSGSMLPTSYVPSSELVSVISCSGAN